MCPGRRLKPFHGDIELSATRLGDPAQLVDRPGRTAVSGLAVPVSRCRSADGRDLDGSIAAGAGRRPARTTTNDTVPFGGRADAGPEREGAGRQGENEAADGPRRLTAEGDGGGARAVDMRLGVGRARGERRRGRHDRDDEHGDPPPAIRPPIHQPASPFFLPCPRCRIRGAPQRRPREGQQAPTGGTVRRAAGSERSRDPSGGRGRRGLAGPIGSRAARRRRTWTAGRRAPRR